ncbi:MAG: YciI family protein [Terriglobales bacterium]
MRFAVLVKATKKSESGAMPDAKILEEMGKYNEELVKAGIMLAADGLHPSSKGTRIKWSGNKKTVVDGPFPETKELVAGFWIWKVNSKEEAIDWAKRCPKPHDEDCVIELRQIFELEDFAPVMTPEMQERENRLRKQVGKKK